MNEESFCDALDCTHNKRRICKIDSERSPCLNYGSKGIKGDECGMEPVIYQPTINRAKHIGKNVKIGAFCDIGKGVVIGDNCNIQAHVCISNNCEIGNNVFIGPNTTLLNDKYIDGIIEPVIIEDDAKIGGGVTVLPGVTISEGMFVGAGSVVTKTFPKHVTVYGNPAKMIERALKRKSRRSR